MAFAFEPSDDSVRAGLRRIAAAQAGRAARRLAAAAEPGAAVHDGRKAVKKLRALVRLARPAGRARLDAELRDIGRLLAPLRDGGVALPLLAELAVAAGVSGPDQLALAGRLASALDAAAPEAAGAGIRAEAADRLAAIAHAAESLAPKRRGFRALARGLEDGFDAASAAMARALDGHDPEAVHDWRKRVKDHWYHARLLAPVWPAAMEVHAAAADALGKRLGAAQDLAMIAAPLRGMPAAPPVLALAETRRRALLDSAGPEGRRLFAGSGHALAVRWGAAWRAAGMPRD